MIKKWQELAFIVAGALVSVFVGLIFLDPKPWFWIIVFFILSTLLLFFGSINIDSLVLKITKYFRNKAKYLRIGILSDIPWDKAKKYYWLKYSPEEWKESILQINNKFFVDLIGVKNSFNKYNVIINPYGGLYPEDDLTNYSTLDKIFKYVKNGGVFLNCADMPGFWAYNPLLNKGINVSKQLDVLDSNGNLQPLNIVSKTPFNKKLNIIVFNIGDQALQYNSISEPSINNIKIYRTAFIESNINNLIHFSYNNRDYSPLFSIDYGEGQFIISLFWFDKNNSDALLNNLKNVILNKMFDLLKKT